MAERETKGKHTYLDFSILIGAQHRFKNPVIHNAEQPIQQLWINSIKRFRNIIRQIGKT